jgi:hypothetical protein
MMTGERHSRLTVFCGKTRLLISKWGNNIIKVYTCQAFFENIFSKLNVLRK